MQQDISKTSQIDHILAYIFDTQTYTEPKLCTDNFSGDLQTCVLCERNSFLKNETQKYLCNNFQRVYLVRTFPAQLVLINRLVTTHKSELIPLMVGRKHYLTAVSYGGGPGTELISLVNNIEASDHIIDLRFDNFDIPSWKNIYQIFSSFVLEKCQNIDVNFIAKFKPQDIGVIKIWERVRRDIIFISWVFSHLHQIDINNAVRNAYHNTHPDGRILIADRVEKRVIDTVNQAIKALFKFPISDKPIIIEEEVDSHCGIDFSVDVRNKFEPRLKYKTHYWIIRHPKRM